MSDNLELDGCRGLDLNLFPAVRLDRALLPMMLSQGSGVIIIGLVEELAKKTGADYDGARRGLMDSLGGITIDARRGRKKWRTSSPSSSRRALAPSPVRSMS